MSERQRIWKNNERTYVRVIVDVDPCGRPTPLEIVWQDGRRFDVERVIDVRPAMSRIDGSEGTRFTLQIKGKKRYLYECEGRWFVGHAMG